MAIKEKKNFEELAVAFLNRNASVEDLKLLIKSLESIKNIQLFKLYIKINYYSVYAMNELETKDIIDVIKARISKENRKVKIFNMFRKTLKYAALFVIAFGLGYFSYINDLGYGVEVKKIVPKADDIVLTNEKGEEIVIKKDEYKNKSLVTIDSKNKVVQKSNELIYDSNSRIEELVFHSLKVPYGKRFDIYLSDGTKVYLNSGSSLRYPVKFLKDKPREVFLDGEAFFDVTESEINMFTVNSNGISVEVYGTKFNVRNYPEDYVSDVVLVKGSVGITNNQSDDIIKLSPGFKGSVNKENFLVETTKINTKLYTSWIDGEVIFRNESFNQIVKKLERLYNVTIINNHESISKELFNANIDVENEKIEDVLSYFNQIYNIEYQIYKNKIIIN
jgi:transmembrane sensor|tara:strand:+ start:266 stop:1438 length:1173 start_codon:yes stop_codon:yes gene_type:complete